MTNVKKDKPIHPAEKRELAILRTANRFICYDCADLSRQEVSWTRAKQIILSNEKHRKLIYAHQHGKDGVLTPEILVTKRLLGFLDQGA